jgi:hypothetical protein
VTALLDALPAELDFEPEIPCVSRKFCSPRQHPASMWITLSCGCPYPMCQRALRIANIRLKAQRLACRLCGAHQITIRSVTRI